MRSPERRSPGSRHRQASAKAEISRSNRFTPSSLPTPSTRRAGQPGGPRRPDGQRVRDGPGVGQQRVLGEQPRVVLAEEHRLLQGAVVAADRARGARIPARARRSRGTARSASSRSGSSGLSRVTTPGEESTAKPGPTSRSSPSSTRRSRRRPAARPAHGRLVDHVTGVAGPLHVAERDLGPVQPDHVHVVSPVGQPLRHGVGDPLDAAQRVGVHAGEHHRSSVPPRRSPTTAPGSGSRIGRRSLPAWSHTAGRRPDTARRGSGSGRGTRVGSKKASTTFAEACPFSSAHHILRNSAYFAANDAATPSRSFSTSISSSVVVRQGPGAIAGRS